MNTILSKCIEELTKDSPRIDYVLGMLETLVQIPSSTTGSINVPYQVSNTPSGTNVPYHVPNLGTILNEPIGLSDEQETDDYIRKYQNGPVGNLS